MKNPSVSVIVAVYQAEPYLCRCIDSILSQTLTDFELLLVNDGSYDRSGVICDEYARNDSRVTVIHKPNEGLSATRQVGIDHAKGEYTIHCDPDDWMDFNMLETLYEKAKITGADIVMCDVMLEHEGLSELSRQFTPKLDTKSLLEVVYCPLSASVCNKLIRLDCYKIYGVTYKKEISYAEDLFAMLQFFLNPLKVEYVDKALYHYDKYSNKNSIVKTISSENIFSSINIMDHYFNGSVDSALIKLKMDALVIAYKNDKHEYEAKFKEYFHECDRDLLLTSVKHPLKLWRRFVIAMHRYHLRYIGDIYAFFIENIKNILEK